MKPWVLIFVFVASIAAVPLEKRDTASLFLGYRVVNLDEADKILKNGMKLVQSTNNGGTQLGKGIYILPGFQQWEQFPENWDCAITVDPAAWATVNMAWVPQSIQKDDICLSLWYMFPSNVRNRVKYLESLDPSWTIENTALLSFVKSHEDKTQMLIPPAIISSIAFNAQCIARLNTEDNAKLALYGTADWTFGGTIKGSPPFYK